MVQGIAINPLNRAAVVAVVREPLLPLQGQPVALAVGLAVMAIS